MGSKIAKMQSIKKKCNFYLKKKKISYLMNKFRNFTTHPFHLVDVSPWPIFMSWGLLSGALAIVSWLTLGENSLVLYLVVLFNIIFISYQWLKDVVREGLAGYHTQAVREGLKLGFTIFL